MLAVCLDLERRLLVKSWNAAMALAFRQNHASLLFPTCILPLVHCNKTLPFSNSFVNFELNILYCVQLRFDAVSSWTISNDGIWHCDPITLMSLCQFLNKLKFVYEFYCYPHHSNLVKYLKNHFEHFLRCFVLYLTLKIKHYSLDAVGQVWLYALEYLNGIEKEKFHDTGSSTFLIHL